VNSTSRRVPVDWIVAWAVVLAVIALRLPQPLHGDTASFATYARGMHAGQFLYRDIWDIKPPGIYLFYYVAEAVFGSSVWGLRLFEALYQLALAALLVFLLRPILDRRAQIWVPVLTTGAYYAVASSWFLEQPEALAAPLIACAVIAAFRASEDRAPTSWCLASGLLAGIAILIKPVYALMPLSAWILAATWRWRSAGSADVARCAGVIAVAAITPLLVTAIVFAVHGELASLLHLLFIEPFAMAETVGVTHGDTLKESIRWIAPFVPGAVLAFALGWWRGDARHRRLLIVIACWVIATAIVILVQVQSWWSYHFVMFIWPAGLAIATAIDVVRGEGRRALGAPIAAIVVVVLAFVPWVELRHPIQAVLRTGYPHDAKQLLDYQVALDDPRGPIGRFLNETAGFRSRSDSDRTLFVFGNPLIYYLTGSLQAIRMQGQTPEYYRPEQWAALETELRQSLPRHIYVRGGHVDLTTREHPAVGALLATRYRIAEKTDGGTWYERIEPR
jgi:4-amino-4-deoxy-L-arabinose transferase-like glycosyltransferase